MMVVRPWNEISDLPISEQLIRELFPFAQGYRFFPSRYDAGVKFPSNIAQPVRLYVLEGECTYSNDAGGTTVKGAEYIDLPPGQYDFEVPVESPVRVMRVFKMPQKP
jgi:hypothetical protein